MSVLVMVYFRMYNINTGHIFVMNTICTKYNYIRSQLILNIRNNINILTIILGRTN